VSFDSVEYFRDKAIASMRLPEGIYVGNYIILALLVIVFLFAVWAYLQAETSWW
jgi:hypothetical protein